MEEGSPDKVEGHARVPSCRDAREWGGATRGCQTKWIHRGVEGNIVVLLGTILPRAEYQQVEKLQIMDTQVR